MPTLEKPVPSDVEAEESVLGSILIDPQAVDTVRGVVEPGDFYREKNGWILSAALAVSDRFDGVDQITVAHELARLNRLEAVGGVAYLSQLVATVPTSVHAVDYAEIVKKCAINRRLVQAGQRIFDLGFENGNPEAGLSKAQEMLLSLQGLTARQGLRSVREVAQRHQAEIDRWLEHPDQLAGVASGFSDLDTTMGGFEAGRFYVLAARPSMGKSQLALTFAVNVARQGKGVAVFTLEMSELSVLFRLVLAGAKVNRYAVRLGKESQDWRQRFGASLASLSALPIWIDDTSAITTATVRVRTAQLKALKPDLGLVVFDYGDLAGDTEGNNEELRIAGITKKLADIAKALNVAVIGVYQLNRKVEDRLNKRPVLSDLRYSGGIEQRADVVMFLYRPAYYRQMEGDPVPPEEEHLLEVLLRKQRDGATGDVRLWFDPKTGEIKPWGEEKNYAH